MSRIEIYSPFSIFYYYLLCSIIYRQNGALPTKKAPFYRRLFLLFKLLKKSSAYGKASADMLSPSYSRKNIRGIKPVCLPWAQTELRLLYHICYRRFSSSDGFPSSGIFCFVCKLGNGRERWQSPFGRKIPA